MSGLEDRLTVTGTFGTGDDDRIKVEGQQTYCVAGDVLKGVVSLTLQPWAEPPLRIELRSWEARYLAQLLTAAASVAGQ